MTTEVSFSIGDFLEAAEEKVGIEGWKAYRWQRLDCGSNLVTGCVPDGVYARGRRKGEPRYSKPLPGTQRVVAITMSEMRVRAARFESTTGKCWKCKGTGQEFAGWSAAEGVRTRRCGRCHGTGKAPPSVLERAAATENVEEVPHA